MVAAPTLVQKRAIAQIQTSCLVIKKRDRVEIEAIKNPIMSIFLSPILSE